MGTSPRLSIYPLSRVLGKPCHTSHSSSIRGSVKQAGAPERDTASDSTRPVSTGVTASGDPSTGVTANGDPSLCTRPVSTGVTASGDPSLCHALSTCPVSTGVTASGDPSLCHALSTCPVSTGITARGGERGPPQYVSCEHQHHSKWGPLSMMCPQYASCEHRHHSKWGALCVTCPQYASCYHRRHSMGRRAGIPLRDVPSVCVL
uniref:Uncharacterized protein n=1 Tax=Paramormyrops kingsleyae TaxID=1676925 RepID=A0A3B3Q5E5_9TELE